MPIINVEILKGRTLQQRRDFVEEVTTLTVNHPKAKRENVIVRIVEHDPSDFAKGGKFIADQ